MRKRIYYFSFLILILFSCIEPQTNFTNDSIPKSIVVALNTEQGYSTHPISGDSIQPLLNSNGDTVKCGVEIPLIGSVVPFDSVNPPQVITVETESASSPFHNVHEVSTGRIIPVDKIALVTFNINNKHDSIEFTNADGKVIPTGKRIDARGEVAPTSLPKPSPALLPVFKENARYNIRNLGIKQGLSNSSMASITEDHDGNIWLTHTIDGITRYDGTHFTHFTSDHGLSNNRVWGSYCDSKGNLWFATNGGGITKYDGSNFIHFTSENNLINDHMNRVIEDRKGNLWFGSNGSGVTRFEPEENGNTGKYTHFTTNEGLSANSILSLLEDKNGDIWVGTEGGGISRINTSLKHALGFTSITHFTTEDGLSNSNVTGLEEDDSGNIWIGTYGGGLLRYDGEKFEQFSTNEGLNNDYIFSIRMDKENNLWIASIQDGVIVYDGSNFTHFTTDEGLAGNSVKHIWEDRQGTIWIATEGNGVSILSKESFAHYNEEEGIESFVLSIAEDENGKLHLSQIGTGISSFNESKTEHTLEMNELLEHITCSFIDSKGSFWYGTRSKGVIRKNGDKFVHYTTHEGLSSNTIYDINEDNGGNIWIGTHHGITKLNNRSQFEYFDEADGLTNNQIRSITKDRDGYLWFGSDAGGLSRYNGKSILNFSEKEGLINNQIHSTLCDQQGNIWVGTGNGLCIFDGNHFTYLMEENGLNNDFISTMAEDHDGNIWISNKKGINRISPAKNEFSIQSFTLNDGLKNYLFTSAFVDHENKIWWGASKSITMLDLNTYPYSEDIPSPQLQWIDINGSYADFNNLAPFEEEGIYYHNPLEFNNYPEHLKLEYYKNHLTFHFSAINWKAPHIVQYSYRIDGLENNWSQPSSEAKADYKNLPFGTYTFRVRARNSNKEWSPAISFEFTILPPWWHTWWAYSLYTITLVLLIMLFIRLRLGQLKRRQIELEEEVAIATEEIQEQKSKVEKERDRSEELLLNILPEETAAELKEHGYSEAKSYDMVTVLFTDFKGFTQLSERLSPEELVQEIDHCYKAFDTITAKYGIEKIKTIGDAYMAAGGVPVSNTTHPLDVVKAALEIRDFMLHYKVMRNQQNKEAFEIRIGVHTGPVVAGIVGIKKFSYDIWGDTVNTASRMESSGEVNMVNISGDTYALIKDDVNCTFRGKIPAKNKGDVEMYFVNRLIWE